MPRYKVQPIDDHGEPATEPDFYTADTDKDAHKLYCDDMIAKGKRPAPKVKITHAVSAPGSAACICKLRPDRDRNRGDVPDEMNSLLDHRCPLHGEKAQPALWGRHKELELLVTPAQWDSLGVTFEG